jgi:hypothetical protein
MWRQDEYGELSPELKVSSHYNLRFNQSFGQIERLISTIQTSNGICFGYEQVHAGANSFHRTAKKLSFKPLLLHSLLEVYLTLKKFTGM